MRKKDEPFISYLNETDESGKPVKHVRWPDQLPKPVERLITELIMDIFSHSGISRDEMQRQELFSFIRRFKSGWDITFKILLGIFAVSSVSAIVYLIRIKA